VAVRAIFPASFGAQAARLTTVALVLPAVQATAPLLLSNLSVPRAIDCPMVAWPHVPAAARRDVASRACPFRRVRPGAARDLAQRARLGASQGVAPPILVSGPLAALPFQDIQFDAGYAGRNLS